MATIKSYTDLSQSKTLSKILPIESADMTYCAIHNIGQKLYHCNVPIFAYASNKDVPCWSLAALLSILPESIYDNTYEYSQLEFSKISVAYHDINDRIKVGSIKDNLVDACYEMIIKLHEMNLL